MLYQTHNPSSLFPCNPFPSTTTKFTHQVEKEMECMLKGGLKAEIMVGLGSKQGICDEVLSSNPQNGEDFFVDQLLNFNNEEGKDDEDEAQNDDVNGVVVVVKEEQEEERQEFNNNNKKKVSSFMSHTLETERNRDDFSVLSVPAEEADLEWLSHFVEDSFSQFSNPYPAQFPEQTKPKPEPGPETHKRPVPFIPPPALSKSRRSKRSRTGGRVWSTALADTPPSSPPTPTPKHRKRDNVLGPVRRCSHCGVQKTPQWRAGPMGAKTLCNACGVRYKSGRLLPEYRPACSPTFSSELHSNNHRKVLEMRRKKEQVVIGPDRAQPGGLAHHPVSSFG